MTSCSTSPTLRSGVIVNSSSGSSIHAARASIRSAVSAGGLWRRTCDSTMAVSVQFEREAPLEDAVTREPRPSLDVVDRRLRRRDRAESRRIGDRGLPRRVRAVRRSVATDAPVRPRLRGRPLDGVVPVVELVAEHVERATVGARLAAHVLHDDRDALAGRRARASIAADGRGASLPYGVRSMMTGNGPPSAGR